MDASAAVPARSPRYPGEDTRLTSAREIKGWYSYGWAAEVFVVCGVGSFIPILLEQLARENGVLLSDHSTPCSSQLPPLVPPGPPGDVGAGPLTSSLISAASPLATWTASPLTSTAPSLTSTASFLTPQTAPRGANQCVIYFLGSEINTASFAMYTFSLSVLVQALLLISISAAADHGRLRKTFLLSFATIGAVATMLFLFVTPRVYVLGAVLAVVANTCIGSSFVLLNSFLPLLVRHHPSVQMSQGTTIRRSSFDGVEDRFGNVARESNDSVLEDELTNSTSALLPHLGEGGDERLDATQLDIKTQGEGVKASPELQLSTKISSRGIGYGYIAATIVQVLSVFIVFSTGGTTFSLRLVLFFIGAWWLVFTVPSAMWLRPRPGPPLIINQREGGAGCFGYVGYAWASLAKTIARARRLQDVILFLCAWFLLSDAIATVSGTAVLFAKTSLDMKPAALAMINVVVMISGMLGAFTWGPVSRALGLRPLQTILVCLFVFELIPIYALLGYLPPIKRAGVIGLQQPWEMYPLGFVYGIVLGGLSSYCRALFSELAPSGFEAAFFALYAITDKGSSVFGPAIVGAITDATGDIRPSFWFLAALIALPMPLMYMINVERGKAAGASLARELDGGIDT